MMNQPMVSGALSAALRWMVKEPATHDRAGPGVTRTRNYAADIISPPIREFTRKVRPRVATAYEDVGCRVD